MLEILDLTKRYGPVVALDGASFTARPGRIVGFLGPNGAGKTTTMRCVFGLAVPDRGEVRWKGQPVDRDMRLRFGYMPEQRGLYPRMRVAEQLSYFGQQHGMSGKAANASAAAWLERMGLGDRAKSKLEELSHGNQQRVQLATALVHDPELLVLDEPFSGLDPINTAIIKEYLSEFRKQGKTIVFSTHVLEQAEKLCDEICLMARSKKILEGPLRDLKRRFSRNLLHISVDAKPEEIAALPGVASAQPVNGGYLVALAPGAAQREFLRRAIDRHDLTGFSAKEPELEEIYLDAVRAAGIEETRPIE